jgi:putative transposase
MVSPARRRDSVTYLVRRRRVSERRARRVVGQHRSTQRYDRVAPEYELRLVHRMNELAGTHPATATGGSVRYPYPQRLKKPGKE